jgi:hypothetical protein
MPRKTNSRITATEVRRLFDYDALTGNLIWKERISIRVTVGRVAGTLAKNGYLTVGIKGVKYYAHRLVWLHVTGEWPAADMDHINGIRADNRIGNLRSVDPAVNMQNRKGANSNNISGLIGAERHRDKWHARISIRGKRVSLGTFATPEEAHAAYLAAKRILHIGCTI